jgi:hypothetical protein
MRCRTQPDDVWSMRHGPVVGIPGAVRERYMDGHGIGYLFEGQLRAIPEGCTIV